MSYKERLEFLLVKQEENGLSHLEKIELVELLKVWEQGVL